MPDNMLRICDRDWAKYVGVGVLCSIVLRREFASACALKQLRNAVRPANKYSSRKKNEREREREKTLAPRRPWKASN